MATKIAAELEHLTAPAPLHFPSEETAPESRRHMKLRTLLFLVLELELKTRAEIGSDQFVYWNASNPKRCLAPDVFLRLGSPSVNFDSWKTWERGAPEVCVEIVSASDEGAEAWDAKLEKYGELGVTELVRFDPDEAPGKRLRVWDRLDNNLVERVVRLDEVTAATVLGLTWMVAPAEDEPVALRLSRDGTVAGLLPTPNEARQAEARGREAAERRIAELEAELARNG